MIINTPVKCALIMIAGGAAVLSVACSSITTRQGDAARHEFTLKGGHFYGPGPIVPDTELPEGRLRNIRFDLDSFSGYAGFHNDGSQEALLSDNETRINQNIDAGLLNIDEGSKPVLLVAVEGGENGGREYYSLARDYSFNWTVDIALDPGFADGIVRVDNFILTTGLVKIAQSAQSEQGIPGGYDRAGTLSSGQYLAGRVGDFDQDGYMDGIVVAAPRVPLEANMLPGAPVGNRRGFETDVELPPHLAGELTLRGIVQFEEPLNELIEKNEIKEVTKLLTDIRSRLKAAQLNMERAAISGPWGPADIKQEGFSISDRLETVRILNFIAISMLEFYPSYGGKVSSPVQDAIGKMFVQLTSLIEKVAAANSKTRQQLPRKSELEPGLNT